MKHKLPNNQDHTASLINIIQITEITILQTKLSIFFLNQLKSFITFAHSSEVSDNSLAIVNRRRMLVNWVVCGFYKRHKKH